MPSRGEYTPLPLAPTSPRLGGPGDDDDDNNNNNNNDDDNVGHGGLGLDGSDDALALLGPLEDVDKGEVDEAAVVVPGEDEINSFVRFLVGTAAISGMLFGYDTGVISGTLVVIGTDLGVPLSTFQKELITSATTCGALLGGLVAGAASDYTGRKGVLAFANIVFVLGAGLQAACHTVRSMVVGRFIVGVGVGLASCIAPLYIGELAPTRQRGRLVTINAVACTLGQVVAYAIGAAFARAPGGWRWMVGLGAAPAVVQLVALVFLPESPRILLLKGDTRKVHKILGRIYPLATPHDVARKVAIMAAAVRQSADIEARTTWAQRAASLVKVGTHRRALVIGCGLQALQQLCGFNTLMYYSATIFAMLGFKNATATGLIIAGVNFIFTLVALRIVDPLGRRPTMLYTIPIMCLALLLAAASFYALTKSTGGVLVPGTAYPPTLTTGVLASMILFVAAYATGCGNIPWQQGELFALEVRGLGTSVATATNWSCNLLIAATFLSLMDRASPAGAFALYAGVCAAGWVFCYLVYPETSGLSLEEVYEVFSDGFGVEKSKAMRAHKVARAREARIAAQAAARRDD